MPVKTPIIHILTSFALLLTTASAQALTLTECNELSDSECLGKNIFFDNSLSSNGNQSCASCHDPKVGWTGSNSSINAAGAAYEGSVKGLFGNRKPPSVAYATQSPVLGFELEQQDDDSEVSVLFTGGSFWDGRATGLRLQSPVARTSSGAISESS